MENKEIKEFSKPRIDSVDRIRGLVMVYMIFMHALGKWTNGEHNWIYGVIWLFADGFGANVFVTISGIGLSLFYISKKNKIESDQNYTKYHARTSYMIKTAWLFLFNILTNLFLGYGFWFWMIMQTLSLGRIFAYPFLQTSPKFKIFVGFIFIFLSEPLNILLEGTGFIYDFFFSQRLWNIPFPFFSFLFMGMAIGDWIYSWRNNTKIIKIPTEKPKIIQAKKLLIIGFCFIIISIIVGYQMIENSVSDFLIYYLNRRSDEATWVYPYTGLPAFMVKNTWQWCIYSLGVQSIILSIFIRKEEIVMQTNQKDNTKFLKSFGRSSLTIYYIQHITFIILLGMFSIQIFIPIIIIYVLMYYYGIRLWTSPNYGKGKYTIEWFINESDAYILKRLNPLFQKWNLGQRNK